jgi:hypothetical protein
MVINELGNGIGSPRPGLDDNLVSVVRNFVYQRIKKTQILEPGFGWNQGIYGIAPLILGFYGIYLFQGPRNRRLGGVYSPFFQGLDELGLISGNPLGEQPFLLSTNGHIRFLWMVMVIINFYSIFMHKSKLYAHFIQQHLTISRFFCINSSMIQTQTP